MTGTVYVAASPVSVISGQANKVTATIPVGAFPDAVAVNPLTGTVFVAERNSNAAAVISGQTNQATANVFVGSLPDGVAVNPQTNTVYVANLGSNTVSVISG